MIHRPIVCRRFIGRQEELAYLHDRRREAGSSHGGLILLVGEAGVGKTRLLEEFCGTLGKSRWRIAQAACLEFAQRPYGPVLGLLARFDPAADELAPAASKHEQLDEIVEALRRAAARNATIAIIEDLHWADVATMELLAHLSASLDRMRMLVIASFRPEEFYPEHPAQAGVAKLARMPRAVRVDLAPLTTREQQLFIDEALGGIELPDQMRRTVARVSDGNPFFIEELLKSAVERGSTRSPATDATTLPATVHATVTERLRLLTEHERLVVAQAAVIGRSFDLGLLAETLATDVQSVLPALRRARDLQLIEETAPRVFRFRHALAREAIYGGFLTAQVQPLHRTIALALEAAHDERRFLESLAYHWWAAGDGQRAATYNERAGDAAAGVHAHDDAIAYYERAAAATEVDAEAPARIAVKIADRRVALGQYDAAADAFSTAARLFQLSGDAEAEAACRVRVALQRYTLGRDEPTAELEEMLGRLDDAQFLARSRVHLGIAWLAATFYHPSVASRHLALVEERAFASAPDIGVRFYNVRAWVWMLVGDATRFRADHAAWLDAARRAGGVGMVAAAHYNGAFCYALFGMHDDAARNIRDALEIAAAERSRHVAASAHGISAFCCMLRGDVPAARDALDALRSLPTNNEVVRAYAMACGTLAGSYLDDREMVEYWFDRLGGSVAPFFASLCGAGFAEVLMRRGCVDEARALLHDGIGTGERQRGNVLTLIAVARYGAEHDLAAARAVLELAADAPDELVERHAIVLFDAIVSERFGRRVDRRCVTEAADGFRRTGFPLLEALAHEAAGERDAAIALFRRCGATYDLRRLELRVPHSSEAAPSQPSADALSAREREIAALVARGGSNIEIGRALSISHKTVEKHLSSMFAKLGFSSRSQLAAYMSRLPGSVST